LEIKKKKEKFMVRQQCEHPMLMLELEERRQLLEDTLNQQQLLQKQHFQQSLPQR
jgi:hypothetical protein